MAKDLVCISLRLTEEENEKLERCAAQCGLSQTKFVRLLCRGEEPKAQPSEKFWSLLECLYDLHEAFAACAPYSPEAEHVCREMEQFILKLQEAECCGGHKSVAHQRKSG